MWLRTLWFFGALVAASLANDETDEILNRVQSLETKLSLLTGQVMMQQLAHEEKIRTDGASGLKQNRILGQGTRPYHTESHTGGRIAAIHNHNDHINTIGMGEIFTVLNGVEFRTRHNDYKLVKPANSSQFRATEIIQYPEVPPEVLEKRTLKEQITELQEWFKAWRDSNYSKRDYRKYFKPVLCYMEGFWVLGDGTGKIDEPFQSDRHQIDASSWHDLLQKMRFTAYSGRKQAAENFAFLPTKIVDFINNSIPVYAQWNYRILCHPLNHDVAIKNFRVVDDINARMKSKTSLKQFAEGRAARFQLYPRTRGKWSKNEFGFVEEVMDSLMNEIPGLDNYPADVIDDAYGYETFRLSGDKSRPMNSGYYHRFFSENQKGAMGGTRRRRGYSDNNIYMAMTTQERIAPSTITTCKRMGRRKPKICTLTSQRWSYAIPLEIIYMTPLQSWNPYNLTYSDDVKISTANKRDGGLEPEKAFNGTNKRLYYITPAEFFQGNEVTEGDKADTAKNQAGVLDPEGKVRTVKSAGIRITLPDIPGVGTVRQRYPIAPVHGEGNALWKEVAAIKDILTRLKTYDYMLNEKLAYLLRQV